MYRRKTLFFLLAASTLVVGCAGQTKRDQEAETALAQYHTTCLKRRLPVDTPEHSRCVAALYLERQNQLTALRSLTASEGSSESAATSPTDDTTSRSY